MILAIAAFCIWNTMMARKEINLLIQENQQQEI
jgi:hypothetical protein